MCQGLKRGQAIKLISGARLSTPNCALNLFIRPGVFVYPLGEKEVVVGFEAVIAGRLLGVQIQSRGKLKDCCLDCYQGSGLEDHCGTSREFGCCGSSGQDMQCTNGEERDGCALFREDKSYAEVQVIMFLDNNRRCYYWLCSLLEAKKMVSKVRNR